MNSEGKNKIAKKKKESKEREREKERDWRGREGVIGRRRVKERKKGG